MRSIISILRVVGALLAMIFMVLMTRIIAWIGIAGDEFLESLYQLLYYIVRRPSIISGAIALLCLFVARKRRTWRTYLSSTQGDFLIKYINTVILLSALMCLFRPLMRCLEVLLSM